MKKFMKVGLVGILSLGILAGCGEVEKVDKDLETENASESEAEKTNPDDVIETDNLKLGETVRIDEFEFTLNTAERFAPTEYDFVEKDGNEFVVVDINVKNIDDEAADPSSLMLSLKTEDGSVKGNTYSSKEESDLATATANTLPSGSGFKAQTSFEVSPDMMAKPFEIIVQNALTEAQAIYKLDGIK